MLVLSVGIVALAVGVVLPTVFAFLFRSRRPEGQKPSLGHTKSQRILLLVLAATLLLVSSEFVWPSGIWHFLLHEVGSALLVSLVIWGMFEAQLSQEAESAWDQRIQRVTENVFQAVLRKDLPKELLDEANNLILNSSLIRDRFTVTYTLRDETFPLANGQSGDCVLVDAVMEFSMKNVSTDTHCWKARVGLPNPIHPAMKDRVRVLGFAVRKGGEPVMFDLKAAELKFRDQLADDQNTTVIFEAGEVSLEPGETCDFSAHYVMAKEAEDSELLQSLYPAERLRLTVFDQAPDGRRVIFAKAVHRQSLQQVSQNATAGQAKIFTIPGYLLPHQGVLIWWKRRPATAE